jgi:DNA-binding GntR family transcriptional regulator
MSTSPSDRITAELRERILSGQLPPGLPLRQEQLAAMYGVSRIPVREALSRLQAERLVTHEQHRGCTVALQPLEDLGELLEIRAALETRALRHALPRMQPADIAHLQSILDRYARAALPGEWSELNLQFHLALYRPAGMPQMLQMIEGLIRGSDRSLRVHLSYIVGRDDPLQDHRQILQACRDGDLARACRLVERHIERTRKVVEQVLRKEAGRRPG